jgi:hypothetical protein
VDVTIRDSVFDGNGAGFGGAVWIDDSQAAIERCCFRNGAGVRGVGIHLSASEVEVADCVFEDNATSDTAISAGGAMYTIGGVVTVLGGVMSGNTAADSGGGGVFNEGSVLVVSGTQITGNLAEGPGGGVAAQGGQTTIQGCVLTHNGAFVPDTAGGVGGAVSGVGGAVAIQSSTISFNSATSDGGGVSVQSADLTLVDCRLRGNTAVARGGGVATTVGDLTATRCSFVSNVAAGGGGTFTANGGMTLHGCLLTGNVATGFVMDEQCLFNGTGGAAWNFTGSLIASSCTIAANRAECNGATGGVVAPLGQLANSILWGNTDDGANVESAQVNLGFFPSIQRCCIEGWTGQLGGVGNIGLDPQFADPLGADGVPGSFDDDRRPLPGSPCNDSGGNALVPIGLETDLDGRPRFLDDPASPDGGAGTPPIVDMGAYESPGTLFCREDLAGGGSVGFDDVLAVIAAWGPCGSCHEDLNLDGDVGFAEILAIITAWGPCP